MGTYPYGAGGACSGPATATTTEIDGELAGAGYRVRSSELRHVAQRLEQLETGFVSFPATATAVDPLDVVHSNPSDIAAWVDSLLSEFNSCSDQALAFNPTPPPQLHINSSEFDSWPESVYPPPPPVTTLTAAAAAARQIEEEEDSGIRLVHLLMSCADSVHRAETSLACCMLEEIKLLLSRVSHASGIGKVAACFADALGRRIYNGISSTTVAGEISPTQHEILYHNFYEATPYLKFAHFTANQAILEAFDGHDRVHVVDFCLMQGLQWPALIQALALRPGGQPSLRLTGIGPPSPDGRDALREVGLRLAQLARSVGVRFAFRGVAAERLDDVKPWMIQLTPGEELAFNSVLQLHKLVGEPGGVNPIDSVLTLVAGLKPRIFTVVEQEANHNQTGFIDRFTEALFYYSTVFDSLEASRVGSPNGSHGLAELYLKREICNVVCCEGTARVERHEPMCRWRARLSRVGFIPVHLGSNAFKQASMLLTLFSGEGGYCVEEVDGCLTLGWHNRRLISASAWRAGDDTNMELLDSILNEPNNIGDENGSENNRSGSSY